MADAGRQVILTGEGYTADHFGRLRAAGFDPVHLDEETLPTRSLVDAHGYVLGGDERLTASLLDSMKALEAISFVGTGIGQFVDCPAAQARGVALMNTPGLMVDAVAEHSLGLLIGLQRGLFHHNEAVKRGAPRPAATRSLADSTVGVVGLGPIGLKVARQLRETLGCELLYWSRTPKPEVEAELGIGYAELDEMFARVDSVLLLLASTPETRAIVGQHLFEAIRVPMFLVNTAAAELVDPHALRAAIDDGRIVAAAFDGYWQEPLPPPADDPYGLLSYPDGKFVVTPHVAAKTTRAWPRMVDAAVDNLLGHFEAAHAA